MKVQIFSASVNPYYEYEYDLVAIGKMSFDEAVDFFDNEDEFGACTHHLYEVDLSKANEFSVCADGAECGDGSDTMFVWVKVS